MSSLRQSKPISIKAFICMLLIAVVVSLIIFRGMFMLMFVPTRSMSPTINAGNLLIGTREAGEVARGDILVFTSPEGVTMIKRLIGLPGEVVFIDESGRVFINDEYLSEPYVEHPRVGLAQEFAVPDKYFLFLGDNRVDSRDARYWDDPFTPVESVLARANFIVLPRPQRL